MEAEVITLAKELILRPSLTPDDAGCQQLLVDRMSGQGFQVWQQRFGEVDNVLIWHGEKPGSALMMLGHTDVVPVGDESQWKHDPFSATIEDGIMYGRGVADMKGSVAAMVLAMEKFVGQNPGHDGKIALMLTSDEEGVATHGVKMFMPEVVKKHQFDYCLVGEPSSNKVLGDCVRVGRRGSLHVKIKVRGKQGHVAYPHLAENPIFNTAAALHELGQMQWDQGNKDFPPSSFQISNIQAGAGANNIIPGHLELVANFRFSPESTQQSLNKQLTAILQKHSLKFELDWQLSGEPFYCDDEKYKRVIAAAIQQNLSVEPVFNTAGGTSDGRFVAPFGIATMELGPINQSIHKVNENQAVKHLIQLECVYLDIINRLLK